MMILVHRLVLVLKQLVADHDCQFRRVGTVRIRMYGVVGHQSGIVVCFDREGGRVRGLQRCGIYKCIFSHLCDENLVSEFGGK